MMYVKIPNNATSSKLTFPVNTLFNDSFWKFNHRFLIDRTPKFVISDPKIPIQTKYGPSNYKYIKNTPFRSSFRKFKGEGSISYRKDPEISD